MRFLSICFFLFAFIFINAQDETILTVGNEKISKSEFERVYQKNNRPTTPDRKTISEYLDLYVNFKLKVLEAKSKGLDTLESFRSELNGYRDQLAKPYLNDTTFLEAAIKEAYERMKVETNVSLILIKCEPHATPADTLAAYKRIQNLRDRIVKKKEPFDKVAREASEDPGAQYNGGYFGYSVAFRFPYEMENAIYSLKIGEISKPIRTKWGYFIAKLNGQRPYRGDVLVAHIMKVVPQGSPQAKSDSAKIKIFEVYEKLKNGGDFDELAKEYSEDHYTSKQGGKLPSFHSGQMVEVFEDSAFALKKPGDFSMPCKTDFGWHIIKLIEKKPIESYETMRPTIKGFVTRDERNNLPAEGVIAKVKKQYGFKEDRSKLKPVLTVVDSTIFHNDWNPEKADKLKESLIQIGDKTFTQRDFAYFLADGKNRQAHSHLEALVMDTYKKFVDESVLSFYKEKLPELYPDFKNIMNEYYDGILLFNITDQMVWSKAIRDTIGLQAFHEGIKGKYMWKDRMKAAIYTCKDKKTADKVRKILTKDKEFVLTIDQIAAKACPDDSARKCVTLKVGTFEKGENKLLDEQKWTAGVSEVIQQDKNFIVVVRKTIIPSEPKKLSEARGFIIADYQAVLEEKWLKELHNKYPVVINKEAISKLEAKYQK